MVAQAGVNEGLPQQSAKAGQTGVELAEAQVAEAEPAEPAKEELAPGPGWELTEAKPAEAEQAEGEQAEGEQAEGEQAEGDEPGWAAEEESRDVSPLAVIGLILGVIALVAVAVGVLAVVTHGFRPKTVVTYRPAAVFGLRPGQCVNSGPNALAVTVLSCAQPHDAEVFAAFSLPATGWSGTSAVQRDASNGCASRLSGYLNPQLATAPLAQEYLYPNEAAWQAGERTVVCEVSAASGRLTGSVRAEG
jgi:hypothetical protein